ncbi:MULTISPECIES: hypothetical protein [unclassified Beijerinckia]|uniref:hypothetical protein n=1 Tax=unclassified Beijerinckia TaxID=2638183 RepID=UPI0008955DA0|nr:MULTISPECIES: hypothetical protein [unclassified Beijerinckia]MDH7797517.1 hypothetical protein [Beijerinckia sp. GAS462]SEC88760.1 hypothetical protein SAMN05443249_3811 [Beijerinckia sp. 28-YEA-48]
MSNVHSIDQIWFNAHPQEVVRCRHATTAELNVFHCRWRNAWALIRRSDGAKVLLDSNWGPFSPEEIEDMFTEPGEAA